MSVSIIDPMLKEDSAMKVPICPTTNKIVTTMR